MTATILTINPSAVAIAVARMSGSAAPAIVTEERTRYHELLIDGIVGVGFKSVEYAQQAERAGYARFTGDQHNERWEWVRERLELTSEQEALAIYIQAKGAK